VASIILGHISNPDTVRRRHLGLRANTETKRTILLKNRAAMRKAYKLSRFYYTRQDMSAKKITAVIIIIVAVVVIGSVLALAFLAPATFADIGNGVVVSLGLEGGDKYQDVSAVELINNVGQYNKEKVRIHGYLQLDGNLVTGLWVNSSYIIKMSVNNPNLQYVAGKQYTVEGTFGGAIINGKVVSGINPDKITVYHG